MSHGANSNFLYIFSAKIINNDKIIFNYTDGATCAHDPLKRPRNVELTILCGENAGVDSQPQFIGESQQDCTYSIYWHRPELCRKETVCMHECMICSFHLTSLSTQTSETASTPPLTKLIVHYVLHKLFHIPSDGRTIDQYIGLFLYWFLPNTKRGQCTGLVEQETTHWFKSAHSLFGRFS